MVGDWQQNSSTFGFGLCAREPFDHFKTVPRGLSPVAHSAYRLELQAFVGYFYRIGKIHIQGRYAEVCAPDTWSLQRNLF